MIEKDKENNMKQQVKAIFFDMDSTLYLHRIHDIVESSKQTLLKLKANGYKVCIATSRCRSELQNLPSFFREFPFDCIITDGGSLVQCDQTMIKKTYLPTEEVYSILNYAKEQHLTVRYATKDGNYFAYPCADRYQDSFFRLYLNAPLTKAYENEPVVNMLIYFDTEKQKEEIPHLFQQSSFADHHELYEITPRDMDKSKGVEVACEYFGITVKETMCFGDGANDIQMIKEAGIGVAMGNGIQALKDASDYVCASIEEDGIMKFCKEHGFID